MSSERVILGEKCNYSFDSKVTGINRNVLVVGGAGTGKTVSIVEPELLETLNAKDPASRIVICTKRTIADKYIPLFREKGFRVHDLNFTDPEKGNCCYNPMAYLRSNEDILELSRSIIMADRRKQGSVADPYWDNAGIALLSAEIAVSRLKDKNATFRDVVTFHHDLRIDGLGYDMSTNHDDMFDQLKDSDDERFAVSQWRTFSDVAAPTARSILSTVSASLQAFTPAVLKSMETKRTVDFRDFVRMRSLIFVTTSPVNKTLHSLASLFTASAISELHWVCDYDMHGRMRRPCHITFDDFATGARVEGMDEKLSISREKNISFTLLLQSESQLFRMYGEYGAVEIMDNCDSYVYMGGNNLKTAQSMSLKLNLPLEDVLYMPVGQVVVFRRGQKPVITRRYDIRKDERYREIMEDGSGCQAEGRKKEIRIAS